MSDYQSRYTGSQIDSGIGKANTAVQPATLESALASKQDTLVSGTNVKTINSNSIIGEGNIEIDTTSGVGFSCWEGKSAVCVGDSITAGSGTTTIYYNILKEILGFSEVTGMGVAGSCVSTTSNYGSKHSPLVSRYQSIPDKDLITIFMGTNDYGHETPMGTIADTTDISFYGALNIIIPGILTAHPNSRLVWITPTHRDGFGSGFTHDWIANNQGNTLQDYVNAIKAVCARYSVPVIDLFSISGLNPVIAGIKSTYMPDGLHPNALGHQKMAVYMAKYLNLYSEFMPEAGQVVSVSGITLNYNSVYVQTGTSETITASIAPANATNKSVTWSIVSGNDLCTITQSGLNCTITAGNSTGTATIQVATQDGNYTATCTANITSSMIHVTDVEITGITSIDVGTTSTLTATITPNNATNQNVTWTITSGSENVTITPNGITCTVEAIGEGTAEITATTQDGNYSDTITVTTQYMWELDYGNRYSGQSAQQTSHARLTPKYANYYFTAGTTVSLDDNETYMWQMKLQESATMTRISTGWEIPPAEGETAGRWTVTKSWTIPTSGYYAIAILKANDSDFDLTTDSNNAFDYITIS